MFDFGYLFEANPNKKMKELTSHRPLLEEAWLTKMSTVVCSPRLFCERILEKAGSPFFDIAFVINALSAQPKKPKTSADAESS